MKKSLMILFWLLFCSISQSHSTIFISQGTPTIDGSIKLSEYNHLSHIRMARFYGVDQFADLYILWDNNFLYIAGKVEDEHLWEDGPGENSWETWNDDGIEIYISSSTSPSNIIDSATKIIAFSITGKYHRIDVGTGDSASPTIGDPKASWDNIIFKSNYSGTLNNNSDIDNYWSFEIAIPWKIIGVSPFAGENLHLNFYIIRDDDGGDRNVFLDSNGVLNDEWFVYRGDRYSPNEWDNFILSGDNAQPIFENTFLSITPVDGRRVKLKFIAPSRDSLNNPCYKYLIRYQEGVSEINSSNWWTMKSYENTYTPNKPGTNEELEIIGLTPGKTYTIGLRAIDERGNLSSQILTQQVTMPSDNTIFITKCPNGRAFCYSTGKPFNIIGAHALIPWITVRGLYNDYVWDSVLGKKRNFYIEEGTSNAEAFINSLFENGINTLSVFVESLDNQILFENTAGNYNNAVIEFIDRLLAFTKPKGIYLILRLYDTYYYKDDWAYTPWGQVGKSSSDNFFDKDLYEMHKQRLAYIINKYKEEDGILGWEIINEIDNKERFNNASFEKREAWLNEMSNFVKSIDTKHLIMFSFITWEPKDDNSHYKEDLGITASLAYRNKNFSAAVPHAYYFHRRNPKDANSGAIEMSQGIAYGFYQIDDYRPIYDGESGPSPLYISSYNDQFDENTANLLFLRSLWLHYVSGGEGAHIRWPWPENQENENDLNNTMKSYLKYFSNSTKNLSFNGKYLNIYRFKEDSLIYTMKSDAKTTIIFVFNPDSKSFSFVRLPEVLQGKVDVTIVNPFNGNSIDYKNIAISDNYLKLPSSFNKDSVIILKHKVAELYTDKAKYSQKEKPVIFSNVNSFYDSDIYLWVELFGKKYYILSLDLSNISEIKQPLFKMLSFQGSIAELPLLNLIENLPVGNYKIGLEINDYKGETFFEIF